MLFSSHLLLMVATEPEALGLVVVSVSRASQSVL
jgi:hypothetical protein